MKNRKSECFSSIFKFVSDLHHLRKTCNLYTNVLIRIDLLYVKLQMIQKFIPSDVNENIKTDEVSFQDIFVLVLCFSFTFHLFRQWRLFFDFIYIYLSVDFLSLWQTWVLLNCQINHVATPTSQVFNSYIIEKFISPPINQ